MTVDKYLIIITTALVITQAIRLVQNTISLVRQNTLIKKQIDAIGEVSDRDLETQREAYSLIVEYLRGKEENEKSESGNYIKKG